jgi:ribosomal protein L37AE/L43A
MTPDLDIRQLSLKALTIYTCVSCGKRATGETYRLEMLPHSFSCSVAQLGDAVAKSTRHISNSHMPVGWAGYGLDVHKCPECQ